ncbi:hypothetical protein ACGIF2_03620 [Cellulomonas sp. P22]|uniref:hypothetical protein n=1 Tax=Cellulomonas sp. P22 TaxID=3373189 RepID=UPI0037A97023
MHHPSAPRRRRPQARAQLVVGLVLGLAVTGCTVTPAPDKSPDATATPSPAALVAATRPLTAAATLVPDAAADVLALTTSRALYERAPVVVLAPAADVAAQLAAASGAVALGAPVLLTGGTVTAGEVADEVARLGATSALRLGDAVVPDGLDVVTLGAPDADAGLGAALAEATGLALGAAQAVAAGTETTAVAAETTVALSLGRPTTAVLQAGTAPAGAATTATSAARTDTATASVPADLAARTALPRVEPPEPPAGAVVLTDGRTEHVAAVATARAAGIPVEVVPDGDPRTRAATVDALGALDATTVLALGSSFGTSELVATRTAAATTGVQAPGGGQLVFPSALGTPGKRYVALYGSPGSGALGVLGEQDVPATVVRAQQTADQYRALTTDTVVPMLEIIATIASAAPEDGSYSRRRPVEDLRPLVDAAGAAGMAVVLDLQPGRTDFLTQAQAYEELLVLPHVSLALDPEWRLGPDQVHLRQIGSVGIDEVNTVVTWLADLTRDRALPQKMLVLHQFSPRMISERERLDTSRDELALLIHVDGQGTQPAKTGTWQALQATAPAGVRWGWKNFVDEDVPMLDPAQTYRVQPVPDLVTYQ